jgi:hypothetical protein
MKRKLKLMPDYQCHPLWGSGPEGPGNVDPSTLPLSDTTVAALNRWAQRFDERLNLEDPPHSREPSAAEVEAFEQEGIRLWKQLRQELASGYEVSYRSEKRGTLFTDPQQLPGSD